MSPRPKVEVDEEPEESVADRLTWLRRGIVTALIIGCILYLATLVISRTDGFRYMVEERLTDRWGMPIQVARVWLNWNGRLILEGVSTKGFTEEGTGTGVLIEAMRVDWRLGYWLWPGRSGVIGVVVHRGVWSFQRNAAGEWPSAYFIGDAEWLAAQFGVRVRTSESPSPQFVEHMAGIDLQSVDLVWWDADARAEASITGLRFGRAGTDVLGRRILYQALSAARVQSGVHEQRNVERDLLWIDGAALPVPPTAR